MAKHSGFHSDAMSRTTPEQQSFPFVWRFAKALSLKREQTLATK
jgi:hypothetical protein